MTNPQVKTRIPILQRYSVKVAEGSPEECWPWTGATDKDGYGIFWSGAYRARGKPLYVKAHRWTYEQFVGAIPAGLSVLHSCDNPPCCNPAHLSVGTTKENHRQREARGRGRRDVGETHYGAVLTETLVRQLRRERKAEGLSGRELGRRHGLNPSTVNNVIYRRAWKHVT